MNVLKTITVVALALVPIIETASQTKPKIVVVPLISTVTEPAATAPNIQILNNDTINTISSLMPGSYVTVEGQITLTNDFLLTNIASLRLNGGSFRSTQFSRIFLGENSVITGITFDGVNLTAAGPVTFINCTFSNSTIPRESIVIESDISDINAPDIEIESLIDTTVDNSIMSVNNISGSTIDDSQISVKRVHDSEIEDSTINDVVIVSNSISEESIFNLIRNEQSIFSGNILTESAINLLSVEGGTTITGNKFMDTHDDETQIIDFSTGVSQNTPRIISITGNDFMLGLSDEAMVVRGVTSSSSVVYSIKSNTIIGGSRAITHSGNTTTFVKDNIVDSFQLGVSSNAVIQLNDNIIQ